MYVRLGFAAIGGLAVFARHVNIHRRNDPAGVGGGDWVRVDLGTRQLGRDRYPLSLSDLSSSP